MKGISPTRRSLEWLRGRGYLVAVVERNLPIPGRFVKSDAFGIADLLAVESGLGILLVQTTSGSNVAGRRAKMTGAILSSEPDDSKARAEAAARRAALEEWLAAGGKFQIHGWAKRGPAGKRKTWTVRVLEARLRSEGENGEPAAVTWEEIPV